MIEDEFSPDDLSYWKGNVRSERFKKTLDDGILYRPEIVRELVQKVESALVSSVSEGIVVKGPQGSGKSHSLVNLVHKLMYGSNNKYLVAFIPDCEKWSTVDDLLGAICGSFGMSVDLMNSQVQGNNILDKRILHSLIANVDSILCKMDKKWVFVFDQINRIFVRPEISHCKDVGVFAFPFHWIK